MKLLFISKYAVNPNYGVPSRQFFFSKYFSRIESNEVLLISSRSTMVKTIPKIKGISRVEEFGACKNLIVNGPTTGLGFNIKRLFSWVWFELLIILKTPTIRKFKPDVIMVSSLSILSFLTGVFFKFLTKSPLVIEVRDLYPQTLVELGGYSDRHVAIRFLRWVEKLGYEHASLLISTLPNAKHHMEEVLGRPVNFLWLPMGFDPELYDNKRQSLEIKEAVSLIKGRSGVFKVGYAGSIGKANALLHIFESANELDGLNENVEFFIIGDGPLKETYEKKFGHLPNLFFLGHFAKADLPFLLSEMDLLVNPWLKLPIYRYGVSPNKWMDYMRAGRPILAPYNGYKFLLNDQKFGWFIEAENTSKLSDAILEIKALPKAQLDTMGQNGLVYLKENLTYDQLAHNLYNALKNVS